MNVLGTLDVVIPNWLQADLLAAVGKQHEALKEMASGDYARCIAGIDALEVADRRLVSLAGVIAKIITDAVGPLAGSRGV